MWWLYDKWTDFKDDCKKAHKSLTVWFSGIISSIIGLLLSLPLDSVIAFMPTLQPYLEDEKFRDAMLILLCVNFVFTALRFKTNKAMRQK
jgi:hypothetical protein